MAQHVFHRWVHSQRDKYTPATYHVLRHNCNHFSQEAAQFLVGTCGAAPTGALDMAWDLTHVAH